MERWRGKVAVVTGASSGIGTTIVKDLLSHGLIVAALARREDRLKEMKNQLPSNQKSLMNPVRCDITDEEDVKRAFDWINKKLGGVDILVNNAGVLRSISILDPNNSKDVRDTVETNVMGVVYCTREAYKTMKTRNNNGHVILINSVSGHRVPDLGPGMSTNVYAASKYAVTALTDTYRQEFANAGTKIKATSISPGPVDTSILPSGFMDKLKGKVKILDPEDISEAVIYALSTKPHVQVQEITIKPVAVEITSVIRQQMSEQ